MKTEDKIDKTKIALKKKQQQISFKIIITEFDNTDVGVSLFDKRYRKQNTVDRNSSLPPSLFPGCLLCLPPSDTCRSVNIKKSKYHQP